MEKKKKKYLVEKLTLTQLTAWLNDKYKKKKSNELFTTNDTVQYVMRKHLPYYLGGHRIELTNEIKGVKLYNVREDRYGI